MSQMSFKCIAKSSVGTQQIYCVPGVLADAARQIQPVVSVLSAYGHVYSLDEVGHGYDSALWTDAITHLATEAFGNDTGVTLIGVSRGGMQTAFIVEALRKRYLLEHLQEQLKVIIVDPPTGVETIKDPLARFTPFLPAGRIADATWGQLFTRKLFPAGVPKWDEITIPSPEVIMQLTGEAMDEETYKSWVQAIGREDLSGHNFSGLSKSTAWMVKVGRDDSLARACESLIDLDITYMPCVHPGNGVVEQPSAVDWWSQHVPTMKVVEVNATHCGFLQNQPEFAAAFEKILAA